MKTQNKWHQTQLVPHSGAGTAWPVHLLKSSSQLLKKHPKIRVKIILKGPFILPNHLATHWLEDKGHLCSGTRLFWGYPCYNKDTATGEAASRRMKILLIQSSFMLLTCPEPLHVTVHKELGRLSWALYHFAYSQQCLTSAPRRKAWISRRIKQA